MKAAIRERENTGRISSSISWSTRDSTDSIGSSTSREMTEDDTPSQGPERGEEEKVSRSSGDFDEPPELSMPDSDPGRVVALDEESYWVMPQNQRGFW